MNKHRPKRVFLRIRKREKLIDRLLSAMRAVPMPVIELQGPCRIEFNGQSFVADQVKLGQEIG